MSGSRQDLLDRLLRERGIRAKAPARIAPAARERFRRQEGDAIVHVFPSSFAQELMWLNAKLAPDNPFYNVPVEATLSGTLDRERLTRALGAVERRHEVLRTTYREEDGAIVQMVREPRSALLEYADVTALPDAERADEVTRLLSLFVRRRFDLERGPVHRALLVRRAPDEHAFLWVVHHIALDGWAVPALVSDLVSSYRGEGRGDKEEEERPPARLQYADYAVWEREHVEPALPEHVAFWKEYLDAAPRRAPLPRERAPGVADQVVERSFSIGGGELVAFDEAMRRLGTTRFVGLAASLAIVVQAWTMEPDVVIGTVHANRSSVEQEEILGNFVNFVPLRLRVEGPTLEAVALASAKSFLQTEAHRVCPYDRIVAGVDPGGAGLYNLALLLQNHADVQQDSGAALGDLRASFTSFSRKSTAVLDLRLVFTQKEGEIACSAELAPGVLAGDQADAFFAALRHVIVRMGASPSDALTSLAFVGARERKQLEAWNQTTQEVAAKSVMGAFRAAAKTYRERPALHFEETTLSYGEFEGAVDGLAADLVANGVGRESVVGVFAERSTELVVALFAVMVAGAAYAPLDPEHPDERIRQVVDDARLTLVLAQPRFVDRARRLASRVVELHADRADGKRTMIAPRATPEGAQAAYVIFTSGSTGRPKGVVNSHEGLANRLAWMQSRYALGPDDVVIQKTPFTFDVSVWEFFWPLLHGASMFVARPGGHRDPTYLAEQMDQRGVTVAHFVPSMLRAFLEVACSVKPRALRLTVCSGEALSAELVQEHARTMPGALANLYGPTEAAIDVTYWDRPPAFADAVVPIGRPVWNTQLYVVDRSLNLVPRGGVGELLLGGVQLARGYAARPDLTAERFIPDPFGGAGGRVYRTGDLVRQAADGAVEYLGRIDHQVKVRGYRIELGEIEVAITRVAGARDAVVVVREVAGDRKIVAYVVRDPAATEGAIEASLRAVLPDYMIPNVWVDVPAIPLTPSGKVDRRALPAPTTVRDAREHVAPESETERRLVAIWQRVLGSESVSALDNFFRVGGHSLLALRIVNETKRDFGVDLPLRSIYEAPVLRAFAHAIDSAAKGAPELSLPVVVADVARRGEPFPLTEVQQAYWIGRRSDLDDGGVACHAYFEVDIEGLDVLRFERAWQKLIDRHDMLRAVVREDGLQQVLAEVAPYAIATLDLRRATDAPEQIERVRAGMSHCVHDATRWPLFTLRAALLPPAAPGTTRTRLFVSFDLLIADATSLEILTREVFEHYADEALQTPPLQITFRDYVLTERAFQTHPLYARSEAYWRARLAELPGAPELPHAGSPPSGAPKFTRRQRVIDSSKWKKLTGRAAEAGITPSGVLMAAYSWVLGAWSRTDRFSFVLTLFNRIPFDERVWDLVGDFTSLTVIDCDVRESSSFEAYAKRLQARLVENLDHRYFGGVSVLRELAQAQGAAGSPIPVVFTSVLGTGDARGSARTDMPTAELAYAITQTPQVWIDHQVYEGAQGITYNWDCVDELFPAGVLGAMFDTYAALVERLCESDEAWTGPKPILVPSSQAMVRARVNATDAPLPDALLHELVLAQASTRGGALAVIAEGRRLTHAELEAHAHVIGAELRSLGARPGQIVAIVMEKDWEQIPAALGVLLSGAAYLPIDGELPEERVRYLLAHSQASIVLTQPRVRPRYTWPEHVRVLDVRAGDELAWDGQRLDSVQSTTDLAYVIYTSGSTGLPKGVMIDHRGAVNTVLDVNAMFHVGATDRVLGLSSMSFDLSVWDVFGVIGAGGALVLPHKDHAADPASWAELVVRENVTIWNTVPALMGMFVDAVEGAHAAKARSLRVCMMSGDWIPLDLPTRIAALGHGTRIVSLGGATEASIWSIYYPVERVDDAWTSIPYGFPMANQRWFVLDDSLLDCPDHVTGELYIGGVGVALGYWRDEARTKERFIARSPSGERLYRTGDLGRYKPDGSIEFLGREDAQVKVQGFRIELGEIEAVLGAHPSVKEAAICVAGERLGSKRLIGFYVPRDPSATEVSSDELRAHLASRLPAYMIPPHMVRVAKLPLSANGKTDRKALLAFDGQQDRSTGEADAAANAVEEVVLALWAEALELEELGVSENLFERGADSVRAARVVHRIRDLLGVQIALRQVFTTPTVRAIAMKILEEPDALARAQIVIEVAQEDETQEDDAS